ncbi:MAG: hypothetical protein LH624_01750 [Cryobacterium sp.]|nr:hypothetical protein [Cryobacterium sp.]
MTAEPPSIATQLNQRLDGVLARLLQPGSRVALLGFPNHGNVGSALWLGARATLARPGIDVVYVCEWRSYREEELRHCLGSVDTILLNGGGNFGDLWDGQQQLREAVLEQF